MTTHLTHEPATGELRSGFSGDLVLPADPGYDAARAVFNAAVDKRPAVIAQCDGVDDVVRAIAFARRHGLEISVRGGGHGVAGTALTDGGLVVDLRRMRTVTVDPTARTATAGGGATMRDLDRATAAHGLATTGGRASTTGIGGLTLGGGTGWLDRLFGLVCDNLLAVELVTAAGERVRASTDEHPELFWALHGGGGNFGVATSFTYRLHPLRTVTAGRIMWDPARGPEVLRAYRDFIADAPDAVGGAIKFHTAPAAGWVPDRLHGRLACTTLITFAGGEAEGRALMGPMLRLGHDVEVIAEYPYVELQHMLDDPPDHRNYWSAEYLRELPDAAIELFCARARDMVVPSASEQVLVPLGGAVARGPEGQTDPWPLPWRRARFHVLPFGCWTDPADDARARRWAQDVRDDMRPWASGAVYLNFIGDEGRDRVVAGLGADHYARLARVKAEYDPDNVFHLNHNILPA